MDNSKFSLEKASKIANDLLQSIRPFCIRAEIAGSIRRKKDQVKDIEIVAIPKPYQTGLFEDGIATIINQFPKIKGELSYGECKYTQRLLPEGIKLDLFFAEEGNFGLIYAIRTGSAEYSHKVLAKGWTERGYKSVGGYLMQQGKKYETREEIDLFKRIGLNYVEPENRNI